MDSVLERYWAGVASRLQVEADLFNSLSGHNGEIGRSNELSLATLVHRLLPPTVGVGTGVIFDSKGAKSHQTDVVAFNTSNQPQLLAQTDQVLFPIETALLAVEVKTTLNAAEVADTGEKCQHLREMYATDGGKVHFSLFAYQCGGSPVGVAEALHALPPEQQPDSVCVLKPGMFGSLDEGFTIGFVPLHRRDSNGDRLSSEWETETEGNAQLAWGMYPTTRTTKWGRAKSKVVTEPGRALLNYCACLLDALSARGQLDTGWLKPYLLPIARERLLIEPKQLGQ